MSKATDSFIKFFDGCDGINVYFVDHANNVYDSDIDAKVLSKFRADFCKDFQNKYCNHEKFSIIPLSNYDERSNALFRFDFDDAEKPFEFSLTEQALKFKATQKVPVYKVTNGQLGNITASIVLLKNSDMNKSMAFYQYIFPVSLLGPDKGLLNITTRKSRLIELEEDVLRLNANFVFVQIGKHYFVENVGTLETRLNFKNVIHSRAQNFAAELAKLDLVEDMTKFNDRITKETAFARKVVKVYKNSAVIKENVTNDDIVKFAQSKPYYSDLKAAENNTSFKLDSVQRCKRFLELLDDDFLKSELTNRDYIARTKDLIKKA